MILFFHRVDIKPPPEASTGHGCIKMVSATKVVTHEKDYGLSQLYLGK